MRPAGSAWRSAPWSTPVGHAAGEQREAWDEGRPHGGGVREREATLLAADALRVREGRARDDIVRVIGARPGEECRRHVPARERARERRPPHPPTRPEELDEKP